MSKIEEFEKNNSFISLMVETKKYKELYTEHFAKYSFVLTALFASLLTYLYNQNAILFLTYIGDVLLALICALIGVIGVCITGLALMAAIITNDSLLEIDKQNKVESFVSLLFSFYFGGALLLITVVEFLGAYFLLKIESNNVDYLVYSIIIVSCLLLFWSLTYVVALLGSCINIFFLNMHFTKLHKKSYDKCIMHNKTVPK